MAKAVGGYQLHGQLISLCPEQEVADGNVSRGWHKTGDSSNSA